MLFLASHDGIGVRPAEGLIPNSRRDNLAAKTRERGGRVNEKTNADNSKSP